MQHLPYLTVHEQPTLRAAVLVTAFAGWPDAGEAATGAVRYLTRSLPATLCASLDAEEFYDFTQQRPLSAITEEGERTIRWPANEFSYWHNPKGGRDLLLFLGIEPHLKWRTFTQTVLTYAQACGVELLVTLGALLNAVPHTREPRVSGRTNHPELSQRLEDQGILQPSSGGYQGPTSIHTALYNAWRGTGLSWGGLWGQAPHYLPQVPNPKVSYSLLQRLGLLLDVDLDLTDLRQAITAFDEEMEKVVARNRELRTYVRKLEEQYVEPSAFQEDIPSPEEMVQDLEEFLRRERGDGSDAASS